MKANQLRWILLFLLVSAVFQLAAQQVEAVRKLVRDLGIPGLGSHGLTRAHIDELVGKAAKASSMKSNPIALVPEELAQILESAISLT